MVLTERERQIRECLQDAHVRIKTNPLLSLVEALIAIAGERGTPDVTQAEALKCIQEGQATPLPASSAPSRIPIPRAAVQPAIPTGVKSTKKPPRRPLSIRINGRAIAVKKANEILSATAEFLIEKGKLQKSSVPISMGKSAYMVNIEPKHSTGAEFHKKRQLSNGLWLDTNFSGQDCEKQAKKLLEYFGMKRTLLEVVWPS